MFVWIYYDISENKSRRKFAQACRKRGMHRVQRSIFFGLLHRNDIRTIQESAKVLLNPRKDSLIILPCSGKMLKSARQFGSVMTDKTILFHTKRFFIF